MRICRMVCRVGVVLWLLSAALPVLAESSDPAYDAAVRLIRKAVEPQPDKGHVARMRGLRQLDDPSLRPLFARLTGSEHADMRVFGVIGLGQLSDDGMINILRVAEIDDPDYVGAALTAAIDDEMIDRDALRTVLGWKDLRMIVRLIAAMKLHTLGEPIDPALFRPVLGRRAIDADTERGVLLEHAYAAALLTELGDPAGPAALETLLGVEHKDSGLVLSNLLSNAMRNQTASLGPFALTLGRDRTRDTILRTQALNAALRLQAPGAVAAWEEWFQAEPDFAQRVRLAMLAMDAAGGLEPGVFDVLLADESDYLRRIGAMGRAIAADDEPAQHAAAEALLEIGVVATTRWLVSYVERAQPSNGAELLDRVARAFVVGFNKQSMKLVSSSSDAVLALCEQYPGKARTLIADMLREPAATEAIGSARLAVVLNGISRVRGGGLGELVERIDTQTYQTPFTRWMTLLQRAKHGLALTDTQWRDTADCIQGAGQIDEEHRTQLAWLYLKHKGLIERALVDAFK